MRMNVCFFQPKIVFNVEIIILLQPKILKYLLSKAPLNNISKSKTFHLKRIYFYRKVELYKQTITIKKIKQSVLYVNQHFNIVKRTNT